MACDAVVPTTAPSEPGNSKIRHICKTWTSSGSSEKNTAKMRVQKPLAAARQKRCTEPWPARPSPIFCITTWGYSSVSSAAGVSGPRPPHLFSLPWCFTLLSDIDGKSPKPRVCSTGGTTFHFPGSSGGCASRPTLHTNAMHSTARVKPAEQGVRRVGRCER